MSVWLRQATQTLYSHNQNIAKAVIMNTGKEIRQFCHVKDFSRVSWCCKAFQHKWGIADEPEQEPADEAEDSAVAWLKSRGTVKPICAKSLPTRKDMICKAEAQAEAKRMMMVAYCKAEAKRMMKNSN